MYRRLRAVGVADAPHLAAREVRGLRDLVVGVAAGQPRRAGQPVEAVPRLPRLPAHRVRLPGEPPPQVELPRGDVAERVHDLARVAEAVVAAVGGDVPSGIRDGLQAAVLVVGVRGAVAHGVERRQEVARLGVDRVGRLPALGVLLVRELVEAWVVGVLGDDRPEVGRQDALESSGCRGRRSRTR